MHFRRLSAIALGAWMAGSLLVAAFRVENSRSADQLLRMPPREAVDALAKLPETEIRAVLLFHASETNLLMTRNWELTQFALGALLLVGFFFSPAGSKSMALMCGLMLASVAFLHWFLTPEMGNLARAAAFAQTPAEAVAQDRMRSLQTGYSTVEYLKLGIGCLLGFVLLKRARRTHRRSGSHSAPAAASVPEAD